MARAMGLVEADLGPWCACDYGNQLLYLHKPHFRITLQTLTASHLHCTAGSLRSFTAIRKDAGLCCESRLRSGEVFAYVGLIHNLKDLKDQNAWSNTMSLYLLVSYCCCSLTVIQIGLPLTLLTSVHWKPLHIDLSLSLNFPLGLPLRALPGGQLVWVHRCRAKTGHLNTFGRPFALKIAQDKTSSLNSGVRW